MNKIELIDRAAAIAAITSFCMADNVCKEFEGKACRGCEYYFCVREISKLPTIDAEWELFQRITDAYYDKQMFFLQDDGSVYDREEAVYHSSTDAAIDAFIRRISEGEDDGKID